MRRHKSDKWMKQVQGGKWITITSSTNGFIQNIVDLKSFDTFPDYNLLCMQIVGTAGETNYTVKSHGSWKPSATRSQPSEISGNLLASDCFLYHYTNFRQVLTGVGRTYRYTRNWIKRYNARVILRIWQKPE